MASYKVTDPETGVTLTLIGDSPPTEQELNDIFAQYQVKPERSLGERVVGGLETAATIASGAVAEPISGLTGIVQAANPFADEGAGAEAVQATRNALTYQPKTEAGKEALQATGEALQPVGDFFENIERGLGDYAYQQTGSPAFAAAATAAPTAFLELLGAGIGSRAVKSADTAVEGAEAALKEAQDFAAGKPTAETVQAGTERIQQGTPEQVTEFAQADPEFFRSLDELGISSEPLAAFASQNPQFRDIQGALRSQVGSVLDVQARNFMEDTAQAADRLIEQYGGTLDKAELSDRFKADSLKEIDNIYEVESDLYGALREIAPLSTKAEAPRTLEFLNQKIDELGGVENLPKELKTIYNGITSENGSTLGFLDYYRKSAGQAQRKASGPFRNMESGLAKALYGRLASDIDAFAESTGNADAIAISDAAKYQTVQRKQIEDNLKTLYGKDLNKSLGKAVSSSLKGLSKGEVDQFRKTINAIPKDKRGEVLITYMNDVFKGSGANQQALNATQFSKWYETISRSPTVKNELFANLPKDSRKAIEALYKVSSGISKSQQQTIPTGRILGMFQPETGFLRKMVGNAGNTLLNIAGGAVGGPAGSLASQMAQDATAEFLNQSTDGARAASNLMASPQFQNLIRDSVKEGVISGNQASQKLQNAERALERTKAYQRWVNTLSADQKGALAGGLIPYLLSPVEEQESTTNNSNEPAQTR